MLNLSGLPDLLYRFIIVSVARLFLLTDSRTGGVEKWEARSGFHFSHPSPLPPTSLAPVVCNPARSVAGRCCNELATVPPAL
jgi:hypothetical protein